LIYFTCTDGASNMIQFGDLLQQQRDVLPVLCAARGFSLTVHYIAKAFDEEAEIFSRASGIISFFGRNDHRIAILQKEYGKDILFIKPCKTRMAYQTLSMIRLLVLREAAAKAMIVLRKKEVDEDDEKIEPSSKFAEVEKSLRDDRLFKLIELFCFASMPALLAMRELDRGTPMAGFVYWLHYHVDSQIDQIMNKLVSEEASSSNVKLKEAVTSAARFVWDKRHRPILTLAYFTNPLLWRDLSRETNLLETHSNFRLDIETALMTMVSKRYKGLKDNIGQVYSEDFILEEYIQLSQQLFEYLKPGTLTKMQQHDAKAKLAADFWTHHLFVPSFLNSRFILDGFTAWLW
jgi:hypothetical protein